MDSNLFNISQQKYPRWEVNFLGNSPTQSWKVSLIMAGLAFPRAFFPLAMTRSTSSCDKQLKPISNKIELGVQWHFSWRSPWMSITTMKTHDRGRVRDPMVSLCVMCGDWTLMIIWTSFWHGDRRQVWGDNKPHYRDNSSRWRTSYIGVKYLVISVCLLISNNQLTLDKS